MKKTLRILIVLTGILLLLLISAVVWIALRSEHIEQLILAQLDASLKTRAHITGMDVNLWDEFPLVSMSLQDVWLAGSGTGGDEAKPFTGDTLLRAERLSLTLDAISLISGQVQVQALTLNGATLVLVQRPDGQWNTDVWKQTSQEENATFEIERLHASDVRFQVNGTGFSVEELKCTGAFQAGQLLADIQGNATVSGIPLALEAHIEQQGDRWECGISRASSRGAQATGTFVWDGERPHLQGTFEQFNAQDWGIELPPDDFGKLEIEGGVNGTFDWDGQNFKSQTEVNQLQLHLLEGLHPWYPEAPSLPLRISVSGTAWVRFDTEGWRVDVPSLKLDSKGAVLEGNLSWTPTRSNWKGSWQAEPPLILWYPLPEGWTWSEGSVSGDAELSIRGDTWKIEGGLSASAVQGTWGTTPWSGVFSGQLDPHALRIEAKSLSALDQVWDVTLTLSDPFGNAPLRGSVSGKTARLVLPSTASSTEEASPWWEVLELPPNSEITARLVLDTLIWEGNVSENHIAQLTLTPRRLRFEDAFLLWGGSSELNGEFRWEPLGGRMDLAYSIQQVRVDRMFREMADFGQTTLRSEHVQGELQSTGNAALNWGPTGTLDWERLRWYGENKVIGGVLDHVESLTSIPDYLSEHRMAAPLIQPADLAAKLKHIALDPIQSPILFANETFHIPYLELTSPELNVSLMGQQTLNGSIDYSVGISLREIRDVTQDDIGEVEDDGLGNHLFIHLGGTLDEPEYKWDRTAQKAHRRKNIQSERERLKQLWNAPSNHLP